MKAKYSSAFIEQARVKAYSRGERTVHAVAEDLNVSYHTLKNWMKKKPAGQVGALAQHERRPQDWRAEDQLLALQETHGLSEEALHAWCREKGLFAHHLAEWKAAFCLQGKGVATGAGPELRGLKEEVEQLKRALQRKDRALAEAAALLVLQKKFRALWEDEVR